MSRLRGTWNALRRGTQRRTRRLLLCGAAAGPIFVTTFSVAGAARAGYRPARHPVSSLALGPGGWVQAVNFAATGALYLAGAAGLAGARPGGPVPALVGAAGLGLLGSAVFVTDPISGYPPGTPDAPSARTVTGTVHDLSAVPVFLGLPAAALLDARFRLRAGQPRWALYSAATAAAMLGGIGLASAAFMQHPSLVDHGGRYQRIAVVTGFTWLTALTLSEAVRRGGS